MHQGHLSNSMPTVFAKTPEGINLRIRELQRNSNTLMDSVIGEKGRERKLSAAGLERVKKQRGDSQKKKETERIIKENLKQLGEHKQFL